MDAKMRKATVQLGETHGDLEQVVIPSNGRTVAVAVVENRFAGCSATAAWI